MVQAGARNEVCICWPGGNRHTVPPCLELAPDGQIRHNVASGAVCAEYDSLAVHVKVLSPRLRADTKRVPAWSPGFSAAFISSPGRGPTLRRRPERLPGSD